MEDISLKDYLEEKFKENKEDHARIEDQTRKTNGSVRKLQIWRAGIIGGLAVIVSCGGFFSTYYFVERNKVETNMDKRFDQIENKIDSLTEAKKEISLLKEQLKNLELINTYDKD